MPSLELTRFHGFELLQATFFVISSCVLREGGREVSVFDINTAQVPQKMYAGLAANGPWRSVWSPHRLHFQPADILPYSGHELGNHMVQDAPSCNMTEFEFESGPSHFFVLLRNVHVSRILQFCLFGRNWPSISILNICISNPIMSYPWTNRLFCWLSAPLPC